MVENTCPYCQTKTAVTTDGNCLHCGQFVGKGDIPPIRSEVDIPNSDREGRSSAAPNPYETPRTYTRDFPRRDYTEQRGLLWLLFSMQGRIPRRTFWGISLGMTLVVWLFMYVLEGAVGLPNGVAEMMFLVLYIPSLWISLAIAVKRWHDRDKSGWWILINFVPLVGPLWAFVETGCLRGTYGPNQYGPDPT